MKVVSFTLLSDGSSDRALVPIIEWLLSQHLGAPFTVQLARAMPPPSAGILARSRAAIADYPCDCLIVHRDAEGETAAHRLGEIQGALEGYVQVCWIPVVPVRMTESWLLLSEEAIRKAAGKSQGKTKLSLPNRKRWEREADPKELLFKAIRTASEKTGRHLAKLDLNDARFRVASLISDFSPLIGLTSFDAFRQSMRHTLTQSGFVWNE